jgi:ABC-type Na+ efflux pump permease subunit
LMIDVRALQIAGLLVLSDPFRGPLDVALMLLALNFAVTAAISTARDRESGTLEVLFYAPVNEASYVLGKTLGVLGSYLLILPVVAAGFVLLAKLSGFLLPPTFALSVVFSVVPVASVIALSILLAIGTNRVRSAVLVLAAVTFVFLGGTAAYSIVLMVPIDNPSSPIVSLRDALAATSSVLRWVSPFAYLQEIVTNGVAIGAWFTAAKALAVSLTMTVTMLVLAALWLRRRGVEGMSE